MSRPNIEFARILRINQTDAEQKLWNLIRNRQLANVKFRRQYSIDVYVLDFYSPELKLAIEVDGGQHYDGKGQRGDELREKKLSKYGIKIIRFSNLEILNNIEGVFEAITPHLNPLPREERK